MLGEFCSGIGDRGHQFILSNVSLNRNTDKTKLYTDKLMKCAQRLAET